MMTLDQVWLFIHFLGLALGFSASFGSMVVGILIAKAVPAEKAILGRVPAMLGTLGRAGLLLLWVTGVILTYAKWGGFAALPWQFQVKLAAVVLLTITTEYIHYLERRVNRGDLSAGASIATLGRVSMLLALIALLFAVLTFG